MSQTAQIYLIYINNKIQFYSLHFQMRVMPTQFSFLWQLPKRSQQDLKMTQIIFIFPLTPFTWRQNKKQKQ